MDQSILLEVILKNLQEGVLVVNKDAVITYINEPSAQITGLKIDSCIGRRLLEVFPDLTEDTSVFYRVLKTGESLLEHVQSYRNSDGKLQTIVTSTLPLFDGEDLIGAIEIYRSLDHVQRLMAKITSLQYALNSLYKQQKDYRNNGTIFTVDHIIGSGEITKSLRQTIYKVADSTVPILVFGETGTGKEVVVQSIHNASLTRRTKPFIAQNCAAIPAALLESIVFGTVAGSFTGAKDSPGLFEQANGGTLFLDEINSMDLTLQAKLLRVLQDGCVTRLGGHKLVKVDVRVIAASNLSAQEILNGGLLRHDLYYRLSGVELTLLPLRQRLDDLDDFIDFFCEEICVKASRRCVVVTAEARELLKDYRWPGNIRQLKSVLEHTLLFLEGDVMDAQDLPLYLQKPSSALSHCGQLSNSGGPLKDKVLAFEKSLIEESLRQSNGNLTQAAKALEMPVQTLHSKIKKWL